LPIAWEDEARHRAAFASDPELYALCVHAAAIHPWQQTRILLLLLTEPRRSLSSSLRTLLERIMLFLLATLSTDQVLTVFLAARRARANHSHTARALLSYLFQHPDIDALVCTRRRVIQDCLEHALGKATARYFGYHAPRRGEDAPLPALLRRYGGSEANVRRLFAQLYFGERSEPRQLVIERSAPREETASGSLVPLLQQFYRVGTSPDLVRNLEAAIVNRAAELPEISGRIALILDASASMRGDVGYEYAPLALAVAFERVMQVKCAELRVYTVGGFGWPPAPEGATDFGRALLDALEGDPELIVLVTDGYENLNQGDTARILASLPALGLAIPVVCCRTRPEPRSPEFTATATDFLPTFALHGEQEFEAALHILALIRTPEAARDSLVTRLRARQEQWETEAYGWTVAS
jgi:hypothetical protein